MVQQTGAWDVKKPWTPDLIASYRVFGPSKAYEYAISAKELFTCEDLAIRIVIDFAATNFLPVFVAVDSYVFDARDRQFSDKSSFYRKVAARLGARDLLKPLNTVNKPHTFGDIEPGDILLIAAAHTQIVSRKIGSFVEVYQGNDMRNYFYNLLHLYTGDPSGQQLYYPGMTPQFGVYDFHTVTTSSGKQVSTPKRYEREGERGQLARLGGREPSTEEGRAVAESWKYTAVRFWNTNAWNRLAFSNNVEA